MQQFAHERPEDWQPHGFSSEVQHQRPKHRDPQPSPTSHDFSSWRPKTEVLQSDDPTHMNLNTTTQRFLEGPTSSRTPVGQWDSLNQQPQWDDQDRLTHGMHPASHAEPPSQHCSFATQSAAKSIAANSKRIEELSKPKQQRPVVLEMGEGENGDRLAKTAKPARQGPVMHLKAIDRNLLAMHPSRREVKATEESIPQPAIVSSGISARATFNAKVETLRQLMSATVVASKKEEAHQQQIPEPALPRKAMQLDTTRDAAPHITVSSKKPAAMVEDRVVNDFLRREISPIYLAATAPAPAHVASRDRSVGHQPPSQSLAPSSRSLSVYQRDDRDRSPQAAVPAEGATGAAKVAIPTDRDSEPRHSSRSSSTTYSLKGKGVLAPQPTKRAHSEGRKAVYPSEEHSKPSWDNRKKTDHFTVPPMLVASKPRKISNAALPKQRDKMDDGLVLVKRIGKSQIIQPPTPNPRLVLAAAPKPMSATVRQRSMSASQKHCERMQRSRSHSESRSDYSHSSHESEGSYLSSTTSSAAYGRQEAMRGGVRGKSRHTDLSEMVSPIAANYQLRRQQTPQCEERSMPAASPSFNFGASDRSPPPLNNMQVLWGACGNGTVRTPDADISHSHHNNSRRANSEALDAAIDVLTHNSHYYGTQHTNPNLSMGNGSWYAAERSPRDTVAAPQMPWSPAPSNNNSRHVHKVSAQSKLDPTLVTAPHSPKSISQSRLRSLSMPSEPSIATLTSPQNESWRSGDEELDLSTTPLAERHDRGRNTRSTTPQPVLRHEVSEHKEKINPRPTKSAVLAPRSERSAMLLERRRKEIGQQRGNTWTGTLRGSSASGKSAMTSASSSRASSAATNASAHDSLQMRATPTVTNDDVPLTNRAQPASLYSYKPAAKKVTILSPSKVGGVVADKVYTCSKASPMKAKGTNNPPKAAPGTVQQKKSPTTSSYKKRAQGTKTLVSPVAVTQSAPSTIPSFSDPHKVAAMYLARREKLSSNPARLVGDVAESSKGATKRLSSPSLGRPETEVEPRKYESEKVPQKHNRPNLWLSPESGELATRRFALGNEERSPYEEFAGKQGATGGGEVGQQLFRNTIEVSYSTTSAVDVSRQQPLRRESTQVFTSQIGFVPSNPPAAAASPIHNLSCTVSPSAEVMIVAASPNGLNDSHTKDDDEGDRRSEPSDATNAINCVATTSKSVGSTRGPSSLTSAVKIPPIDQNYVASATTRLVSLGRSRTASSSRDSSRLRSHGGSPSPSPMRVALPKKSAQRRSESATASTLSLAHSAARDESREFYSVESGVPQSLGRANSSANVFRYLFSMDAEGRHVQPSSQPRVSESPASSNHRTADNLDVRSPSPRFSTAINKATGPTSNALLARMETIQRALSECS